MTKPASNAQSSVYTPWLGIDRSPDVDPGHAWSGTNGVTP